MKSLRYILALGAFFVVAAGVSACGSGVPGNAVVDMAGNPVTLTAYKHWMFVAAKGNAAQSPGSPVIVPTDPPGFSACIAQARKEIPSLAKTPAKTLRADCDQLFTSLNATVMDFLIKGYWYQAEAHRLGIKLTKAQLQSAFVSAKNQQFKTQAAFTAFLSETGQTLNDILFRVRINQLFTKLEARHALSVTPASIAAYYKAHISQFGRPETRNIRIVRTKTAAAAAAAKAALLHGQSWSVVAKKYSIDTATKNSGGLLKGVTSGQEETALNNAAFAAPLNKVEGVIHGTFGYYTFEVTAITKSTQQTLAQATPLIKELIGSQNSTTEQSKVDAVAKKHWFTKTTCRAAYSMADCHGYKAPKTTATTPTTSATTPATSGTPTQTSTVTTAPTPTTSTTPTTAG
ncbi:MAG TPA: peptidylprolyl isomerase [Solirubrobacteraceae bacterium]|nr:peptidylprolyl isomerase [Solirubrobacteraceae bacterium]